MPPATGQPRKRAGRKPYICLMRDAVLADSMAGAEAASEPTMYTHRFYFQYDAYVQDEHIKDVKTPEELSFDIASKERLIVGSPKTAWSNSRCGKRRFSRII